MRGGTRSPDGLRLQDEALDGAEEPLSVEVVAPAALAHEESIRLRGDEVGEDVGALVDVDVPLQHPPVDTPEDPRADVMVTAFRRSAQRLAASAAAHDARAAIDAQLGYQTVADADAFVCATSSPLTSPVAVNAITITVADANSFPASGTVTIDEGLPAAETLVYTSRTSTQLLTAPATFAHNIDAMVAVVGSVGKGWGDTSNPSAGGALVGVI